MMRLLQAILNSGSSGKSMKICRICGEEYREEHKECDFCGCPEEWIFGQDWKFPREFREVYELVKVFDTRDPFPDGLYWSTERENVVCIHKLPAEEAGWNCCRFMERLGEAEEWHPEIYKIVPPQQKNCGYYVCEYRPGKTLQELTERENPPGEEISEFIRRGIQELLQKTEQKGGNAGIFDLTHLKIADGKLVLTNLGPGDYSVSDQVQAKRLIRRLQRGWWDDEETAQASGFWRKIFKKQKEV